MKLTYTKEYVLERLRLKQKEEQDRQSEKFLKAREALVKLKNELPDIIAAYDKWAHAKGQLRFPQFSMPYLSSMYFSDNLAGLIRRIETAQEKTFHVGPNDELYRYM